MRYARSAFIVVLLVLVTLAGFATQKKQKPPPSLPGAVVKVLIENGHGSGVHIGGGYVLTAAHVAGDSKTLKIKNDADGESEAEVLWASKDYDVALLRTNMRLQSARLNCNAVPVGTAVHAIGNPAQLEFITTYGRIGGLRGPAEAIWKDTIVASMTIVPGMSGGGLFNDANDLVGILVGTMSRPSFGGDSLISLGFVVPATAFCGMLGRGF